jgi:hypothetical protein
MKDLEKLQKEEAAAMKKLSAIRQDIGEIERTALLPEIKAKYEGKFYKYRNSFSLPKTEKDYWFMYVSVGKVENPYQFKGKTFQIDSDGIITFDAKNHVRPQFCQTEITEAEYEAALKKLTDRIKRF